MGIQTIKTESGDELVILSRREYDALLAQNGDADAEDAMTLLIAAEARSGATLPAPVSAAVLDGQSVLRAVRKWRGVTQADLAGRSGVAQGYLSEIENRTKTGTPDSLAKIAQALDVPSAWL